MLAVSNDKIRLVELVLLPVSTMVVVRCYVLVIIKRLCQYLLAGWLSTKEQGYLWY